MAAQSLYRKWRSQTFDELVGQEHVVQTLRNAIVEDRVAHAYLFTGPRGVGKTSMARLLSKAVNCLSPLPERPCGHCAACVSIAEGRAVDVVEIDAASHTSVEDAREIIERVQFRPAELRFKVYVLDEVHMLSTAAFNALLKTLEEPPDHAIFIMATTEVHKVPATILSRCQRFTFTRHTVASTAAHLRHIAEAEGLTLEAGAPEAIARSATGSMRDALSVLEQLGSFASGPITLQQVNDLLGMTAAAEVNSLVQALISNDLGAALRAVNGVADQGADIRQFTRDLVERLRALMLLVASGDRSLLDVGDDELAELEQWAAQADAALLLHWTRIFSGLDHQLRTSTYGHLPLELAVVEALVGTPQVAAVPASTPRPAVPARPAPAPARSAPPARPHVVEQRIAQPTVAPAPEVPTSPPVPAEPVAAPAVGELVGEPPHHETPVDTEQAESTEAPSPMTAAAKSAFDEEAARAANADISTFEQVESLWPQVVRDVRPFSTTVQALLKDVRPIDVEGNTIVLLATSRFHKENLEKHPNRQIVEEVIKKRFGSVFAIRCTTETRAETRDLRGQIREARKDALVKAAMNIFEADIVDIEPE
jgi:DNA polymerase III subunit gamma/tau